MEPWLIGTLVCFAYLAISLWTGLSGTRQGSKDVAAFVTGSRAVSTLVLYFVIGATVFSSFAFLGTPAWAYTRGAAAYYILGYGVIGLVPFFLIGARANRLGARFGFMTQAELFAHRFQSPALSVLLALISVVALLPYLALQIKGAGYILEVISDGRIPVWLGGLISYAVVLAYVWFAGVWGVGFSSVFQGILMLVVAFFLGWYVPEKLYGGMREMTEALLASDFGSRLTIPGTDAGGAPWPGGQFMSAVLVSAAGYSMWPHLFMKAFTAKDEAGFKKSMLMYPTFQLFLVPMVIIGLAAVLKFPGVQPADTLVPVLLKGIGMPAVLVGLVCAGALAASMSSGDAMLHAAATITVRDGLNPIKPGLSDDRQKTLIRHFILVYGALAYLIAVLSPADIVQLLLGSYGGIAQLLPVALAAFYWPDVNAKSALSGLAAGILVNTIFFLMPEWKPFPVHEGLLGLAANTVVLTLVTLVTRPQSADHLKAYFDL